MEIKSTTEEKIKFSMPLFGWIVYVLIVAVITWEVFCYIDGVTL